MNRKGRAKLHGLQRGKSSDRNRAAGGLRQIEKAGLSTDGLRSKSWDEFSQPGAPPSQFRLYGLRQRRQRSMSDLARAADDGALGHSRPGRRAGHARRDRTRIQSGFSRLSTGASASSSALPLATLDTFAHPKKELFEPKWVSQHHASKGKEKVIFACVHNAGRSQMAAAFFNQLADPTKAKHIRRNGAGLRVHPRSCP